MNSHYPMTTPTAPHELHGTDLPVQVYRAWQSGMPERLPATPLSGHYTLVKYLFALGWRLRAQSRTKLKRRMNSGWKSYFGVLVSSKALRMKVEKIISGAGAAPKHGDTVRVHYTG